MPSACVWAPIVVIVDLGQSSIFLWNGSRDVVRQWLKKTVEDRKPFFGSPHSNAPLPQCPHLSSIKRPFLACCTSRFNNAYVVAEFHCFLSIVLDYCYGITMLRLPWRIYFLLLLLLGVFVAGYQDEEEKEGDPGLFYFVSVCISCDL